MTEPRHDEGPEVRPETTAILAGRAAADRSLAPVLYPTSTVEVDTVEQGRDQCAPQGGG